MGWNIENGFFVFCACNTESFVPFAEDIYSAVFSQKAVRDELTTLQESFPNIRFSRIAAVPRIRLEWINERIKLSIIIKRRDKYIEVKTPSMGGRNYVLHDNTWVYLSPEIELIDTLIQGLKIEDIQSVPFSAYIKVLEYVRTEEYASIVIEDSVSDLLHNSTTSLADAVPYNLHARLYPYQEIGYRWLKYITDEACGCILGDEMGLGKTLQVIALLLQRKNEGKGPSLVVAPVSLLENWRREIDKFSPDLNTLVHHGGGRTGRYTTLLSFDVVITAYSTVSTDLSMLSMVSWDLLVLDEAQNIKNPTATRTISVKELHRRAGIAVTGTPFENHILDLWSLLDFAIPGCVGDKATFSRFYSDDINGAERIEPTLSALMIRRNVDEVAKDLPDKILIPQPLVMSDVEAMRYEDTRQSILASFDARAVTLAILTKLRMYCTHPSIVESEFTGTDPIQISTKYARLCELVDEIVAAKEKVIVFTSYTEMFNVFEEDIPRRFGIPVASINGGTPVENRQRIIDTFSQIDGSAMLVLNPRAAGVGLNITAANHVIHYNLEWNPALEDQATARSFRRGQEKTVFIYRLYYVDTVEEFVNDKILHKREMSETAVVGSSGEENSRQLILQAIEKSPVKRGVAYE